MGYSWVFTKDERNRTNLRVESDESEESQDPLLGGRHSALESPIAKKFARWVLLPNLQASRAAPPSGANRSTQASRLSRSAAVPSFIYPRYCTVSQTKVGVNNLAEI